MGTFKTIPVVIDTNVLVSGHHCPVLCLQNARLVTGRQMVVAFYNHFVAGKRLLHETSSKHLRSLNFVLCL